MQRSHPTAGGVEITFLGTGTSNGIPIIGCTCPVCTSDDPRDRRSRTSAVVRFDGHTVLIDTATELRLQALAVGLDRIDAVLFTHAHADHVGGFDDLRRFNELAQRHLPVYAHPDTAAILRERFGYAFVDQFPFYGGKPDLTLHTFNGAFTLFDRRIQPIPVWHGRWLVHGFRFGPLVYLTDAKTIPPASLETMRGADVLVINALRQRPHPTHLSIDEALAVIAEVKPRRAYLVHLAHEVSHAATSALLPPHVELAYDGLTVRTQADW
ncbi:MAG: MBL fold metallo-hydrolase [Sphaerobacter sp.]|nr:MBL fold metallo-hydrolase [Sphaerobacter sp.]